jgi:nitrogen regulatory protein PII
MKVKATSTIIAFDGGQMVVINAGETGELSDALAETEIASGKAVAVKGKGKASEVAEAPEAEETGETVAP